MNILFLTDGQFADIMCLVPVCKSLKDSGHDISLVYNDNGTARLFKLFLDDYKFFDYVNSFSKKKAKTGDRFIQWMTHSNFDIVVANKEKFRWVLPYVRSEIRYLKEYDGIHFTDNTFRLLGDLIDNKEPSVPCPIKSVKKRIFDKTNYKDQKFLAIAPTFTKTGSGYQHHWGTENYVNFINSLSYDWKPILIDRDDGISLCNQINFLTHKRCLNLAGCLTLAEMASIISESDALIGNLCEASYLAASLQKVSVILCGPVANLDKRPLSKDVIVFRAESPDNIQTNSQKELVNLNIKYISLLKPEIVLETLGERFKNEEALLTN